MLDAHRDLDDLAGHRVVTPQSASCNMPGVLTAQRDFRLSRAGNWLARHQTQALEVLMRMEHLLRAPGKRELIARDWQILQPVLAQLGSGLTPCDGILQCH